MYSLVNASTLGFDLLRRPGGTEVAALLASALTLTPGDLPVLAAAHRDDPARTAAWSQVMAVESSAVPMVDAVRRAAQLCADPADLGAATRLLERAAIGNLDGLLRCIRHDIFDWTWNSRGDFAMHDEPTTRALAVVCDAAAGGYHRGRLPGAAVRRLQADWVTGSGRISTPVVIPRADDDPVGALLIRLGRLDPAGRQELRAAASRAQGSGTAWAVAMHEATWAVHLSGLVREAAVMQLVATEAFTRAGFGSADATGGVWNLVSGALQGLTVRDLADDTALERLIGPVEPILGPFAG